MYMMEKVLIFCNAGKLFFFFFILSKMASTKNKMNLEKNDKFLLYLITIIIDLFLLFLLLDDTHRLVSRDQNYIYIIFSIHLFFYYILWFEKYSFLTIAHLLMMVSLLYGLVAESIQIQFILLGLLLTIQILWIYKKKCIMLLPMKNNQKSGYNNEFQVLSYIYTVLFSLRIGYRFAYDSYHEK